MSSITIDPVLGIALVACLLAAWYRVHKRWLRRCKCCGAMWRVRRVHEKHFLRFVGNGKAQAAHDTFFYCLNRRCKAYNVEVLEKAYTKEVPSKLVASTAL